MKSLLSVLICLLIYSQSFAQVLYDPQNLYESPGGLFDPDSIRTVELTFYDQNYNFILDQGWQNETGIRLPALLEMNGQVYDSVAVRYKGNSTYYWAAQTNNPKVPYNIDMNDLVSGQNLMGYNKLKLANALFDPTFVKETVGYSLYRNYMPSPEANLLRLRVQGNYLGLYVNTESVNKQFLQKHFGEKDGVLFKCDPDAQFGSGDPFIPPDLLWYGADSADYYVRYELKTDGGWNQLLELIDTLNHAPQHIDSVLNVDRVLWYFALNSVLPNTDTYNQLVVHNYYLYRTGDGLFQIIPWDLSECFINVMIDWVGDQDSIYYFSPYDGYAPYDAGKPLVYQLLSNPIYHKQYTAHLRTILDEFFPSVTPVENKALNLQNLAFNAVSTDPNKWFTMSHFSNNVYNLINIFGQNYAGIVSTMNRRLPYLRSHPEISKIPPEILQVSQSIPNPNPGENVYITAEVSGGSTVDLMATNSPFHSKFQTIAMRDDGMGGDQVANDGIFTALMPFNGAGEQISYYVRAQNTDAMALSPARAEYEFYFYDIPATVDNSTASIPGILEIFPNPALDRVTIRLGEGRLESVRLFDLSGREISVYRNLSGRQFAMDLASLEKGCYLLQVESADGRQQVKKLLVQ